MAEFATAAGRNAAPVLVVTGELDMSSEDELLAHARRLLAGGTDVDVDLSGVTFVDSSGLGALVRLHKLVTGAGRELHLSRVPRPVARILELTGLTDLFADRSGS